MTELSIVATLYESESYIDEFYKRMAAAARRVSSDYEIIFVNDGSPDNSLDKALDHCRRDPRVSVIDLSRNFGHHRAMMTGLAHANGELVFLIDSDLEEDPELLERFYEERQRLDVDVVYGIQEKRRGTWFERVTGRIFFALFNLLSADPIPTNVVVVRLMTARYVAALVSHREREILIAGLWAITGFDQRPIPVTKKHKGSTSYSLLRKLQLLVNAVTSFSTKPLLFVFYLGLAILTASGAAASFFIIRRLAMGTTLMGWSSLMVAVCFFGGLTIFCQGLLGIYLAKAYSEVKQRPYAIIREHYGHETDGTTSSPEDPV